MIEEIKNELNEAGHDGLGAQQSTFGRSRKRCGEVAIRVLHAFLEPRKFIASYVDLKCFVQDFACEIEYVIALIGQRFYQRED